MKIIRLLLLVSGVDALILGFTHNGPWSYVSVVVGGMMLGAFVGTLEES